MKLIILTSLLYCLLLSDLGEAQLDPCRGPSQRTRGCSGGEAQLDPCRGPLQRTRGCSGTGRKRRQILEEILAEVEEVERERREAHSHLAKATNHDTTHGIATHKSPAAHDQHAAGPLSYGHLAGEQQAAHGHRNKRDAQRDENQTFNCQGTRGCGKKRRQILEEILAEVEEVERERRDAHSHLAKATNHGTAQDHHQSEDHVGGQQVYGQAEGKAQDHGVQGEGEKQVHGHFEGKAEVHGHQAEGKAEAHGNHAEIKGQVHGHRQGEGEALADGHQSVVKAHLHGRHAEGKAKAQSFHAEGNSLDKQEVGNARAHGLEVEGKAHAHDQSEREAQGHDHQIEGKSEAHGHNSEHFARKKREIADAINYLTQEVLDAENEEIEKRGFFPRRKREVIAALLAELS